jgi:hypothetical protein
VAGLIFLTAAALWIARPHGAAERMLYHSGLDKVVGADHIFHTVGEGVVAFESQA